MRNWYAAARTHPSAVLLGVQLGGLLVYPFLDDQAIGRALFGVFGLVVLALALLTVRATPALTWVSLLLGLPVVVLTVVEGFVPGNDPVVLTSSVFHAAFYFYTAYALIRYMFADDVVTSDELFATGAAFTVVAWAFAYVYVAAQVIWPGSFTAAVDPAGDRTWVELLFLSVTTLSSTGLSDIVPILPHARSVVMVEQIAGMLYLALVVARITALTVTRIGKDSNSRSS
ncbi:ion channel [Nocardioides sp.]|uniref:ion channel n=1 Tax=Nocardioides sp. TaxID=35761 RepID=UPI003D0A096E